MNNTTFQKTLDQVRQTLFDALNRQEHPDLDTVARVLAREQLLTDYAYQMISNGLLPHTYLESLQSATPRTESEKEAINNLFNAINNLFNKIAA